MATSPLTLPASQLTPGLWIEVPEGVGEPWGWKLLEEVQKKEEEMHISGRGWRYSLPPTFLLLTSSQVPEGVPPRKSNPTFDEHFLSLASTIAHAARCRRRQVGALLVSFPEDDFPREVASGFNSYPWGLPGCWEGACPRGLASPATVGAYSSYEEETSPGYCASRHAEMMALQRAGEKARGTTLYITDKPCHNCHKHIAHAGVTRMVWPEGEATPLSLYSRPADSPSTGLRRHLP